MMSVKLIRTFSGQPLAPHRTLQVLTGRWFVLAWMHSFERGWWFADRGMWCFGAAWISFNVFNVKRSA